MADITLPVPGESPNWGTKLNTAILRINQELEALGVRVSVAETGLSSVTFRVSNLEGRVSSLETGLEAEIIRIAADVISSDPTVIAAATDAVADALADGMDERYVNEQLLRSPVTGFEVPIVMANGRVIGGVYADGTVEFYKFASGSPDPGEGADPPVGGGSAAIEGQTVSSIHRVACIGDSLTRGFYNGSDWPLSDGWPSKLDTEATVLNLGVSGQTVDELGIGLGALPVVLQSGVTVPASGSVAVTVQSGIGWRPDRTWSFHGRLAGIPGTLTRTGTATTALSFSPDSGRTSSTSVPSGARFVGDASDGWDMVILGAGRNDVSYEVTGSHSTVTEHVQVGLRRIINWLKPQRKRFLIWGTTNATNETSGTGRYSQVIAINGWCQDSYPLNWVDVRSWLVNDAIYAMGITPTAADLTAMGNDVAPPSIMNDSVHWVKGVATALAPFLSLHLQRRDWKVY